jgi:signal transduction histidine kinase
MYILIIVILIAVIIYLIRRELSRRFTEESFLSIVNHTFRTPLTSIKWMSEALGTELPRKEQIDISKNLATSVSRLMGIVDTLTGIKDVHNAASYDLKAVSLREILEESIRKYGPQISEKKITLSVPTFHEMPLLSIDTKKVSFAIGAIIENAIWYSKEGGSISMDSQIRGNELTLNITDDGIGLTKKDKSNIFARFYRGDIAKKMNTDGMGIGLYMAREIIKRHGGTIEVSSKGTDTGTTFSIKLPVTR